MPQISVIPPTTAARTPAAFSPVPVRPRADGWTPDRQTRFIAMLAATRCATAAARAVGLTRESAYRLRRRPDAGDFASAWDDAVRWDPPVTPLPARRGKEENIGFTPSLSSPS